MRHFIMDTETTGLIKNSLQPLKHQPRVIEFYARIDNDAGELLEEIEFFCDPGVPVSAEITKITGIKPEDVKGQPAFSHFSPRIKEMIESCDVCVAHNLSFDMAIVDMDMSRSKVEFDWPATKLCTVEGSEHLKGHRLNLSALHELLFGEPFAGAHRARTDVEALARCYHELVARGEI